MNIRLVGIFLALLWVGACAGIVMDRSMSAVDANDLTLAMGACQPVPMGGFDACRVKEGQAIESSWRIYLPPKMHAVLGGELTVYFHDVAQAYAINGPLIEIPWKDFFKDDTWRLDYDGTARALGIVRYKDTEGIEQTVKVRGEARILVLKDGYDPMPIDSGFASFTTKCKIQYSTAGRSAVKCD